MSAVPTPEETATLEPVEPLQLQVPLTATQRMARLAANLIRKLLGPFPWVMPPSWDARTVLVGDYLMFPGMILWYLVLPLAVVWVGAAAVQRPR